MPTKPARSAAELERDIVHQRQGELITRLEKEILRSIDAVKVDDPVECIYLTGPGSNLPRVREELALRVRLPVQNLEVLDVAEHRFSPSEAKIVNAIVPATAGLALKNIGHDPLEFDFRQEEFVFTRKFDRLKVPLFFMAFLLLVANFCWFLLNQKRQEEIDSIGKNAAQQAGSYLARITKDKVQKKDTTFMEVVGHSDKELDKKYKNAANYPGAERLDYVDNTIRAMERKLIKDYSLGSTRSKRRGSKVKRSGRSSKAKDPSDFVSGLLRLEQVFKAVADSGIKGYAMNRLNVQPTQVDVDLTLPQVARIAGQQGGLSIQDQIVRIKDKLSEIAGEDYERVEDPGNHKEREDGRGFDIRGLKFIFRKES